MTVDLGGPAGVSDANEAKSGFEDKEVPPNQSLERTHQTVIKFAYANLPPVWRAAQLSC
jgi:hypothetical protein